MAQRVNLREVKQHLARYVKAAEAGERIVITRRGKPVALLSPLPREKRSLSAAQEAALERLLSQSHHLGGRAPSRDELHEMAGGYRSEAEDSSLDRGWVEVESKRL
jgi:prevent-host-death family protein